MINRFVRAIVPMAGSRSGSCVSAASLGEGLLGCLFPLRFAGTRLSRFHDEFSEGVDEGMMCLTGTPRILRLACYTFYSKYGCLWRTLPARITVRRLCHSKVTGERHFGELCQGEIEPRC